MALSGSSCPLGEHYVRRHPRSTKKGMTQVSARLDPLVNIAAGIRWLGHKIDRLPNRYKSRDISKNIFNGFKYYHSWTQKGENHANKVYRYYNETLGQ